MVRISLKLAETIDRRMLCGNRDSGNIPEKILPSISLASQRGRFILVISK